MEKTKRKTMQEMKTEKKENGWIAAFKFLPLLVFAITVIIFKLDLLVAAPIATFSAICVYMLVERANFEDAFEQGLNSARKIALIFFIFTPVCQS